MANSSAARPCLQRVLQTCRQTMLGRPYMPIVTTQSQTRQASSDVSIPQPSKSATAALPIPTNKNKKNKELPKVRRRPNRDHNKQRGLSVIRRTGPREVLSVSGLPLPKPVAPEEFPKVKTDPNHGLWDFFYSRDKPLNTPKEDSAHGRAWNVEELRRKSWEDLHRLWWVCCKERNRIATGNVERKKGQYGYGDVESRAREIEVRKTQNAIKHALTERYYAWEDALELARGDPQYQFAEDGSRVRYISPKKPVQEDYEPVWEDDELGEEEKDSFMSEEPASHESVDPSIPPNAGKAGGDAPRV